MSAGFSRRSLLAAGAGALFPLRAQAQKPLVVGSKIDVEGAVLGRLVLFALERAGVATRARLSLGPTAILRQALLSGEVDLCVEYTGNAAVFFHQEGDPVWRDARAGFLRARDEDLSRNGIVWLEPAPADNAWVIAAPRALARQAGLGSLADFARFARSGAPLRLAASAEFVESPAGLPSFEAAYGFRLSADQLLVLSGGQTIATMKAAASGVSGVNAAMAYRTDGALEALGLVALDDPSRSQPVYAPAPVIRAAALEAWPAVAPALANLFASLDVAALRTLNAGAAVEGRDAQEIARAWFSGRGA